MNIVSRGKQIKGFFSENVRYIVVVLFFLVVSFYSLVIVPNDEKKTAKKTVDEQTEAVRFPDLDHVATSKVYDDVLDSHVGDAYRVIIRAEANDVTDVKLVSRALDGRSMDVSSFTLPKGTPTYREAVFFTDGEYRDIVVGLTEQGAADNPQWNDTQVFIDRLSVTRLSVKTPAEASRLQSTLFGIPQETMQYLPAHQTGSEDDSFGKSKVNFGQFFQPTKENFSGIRFRAGLAGTGGAGSYVAEIRECTDVACSLSTAKVLDKVAFTGDGLAQYKTAGSDVYELPLSALVDTGKLYYVGISAAGVKVDNTNFLLFRKIGGEDAAKNSFFGAAYLKKADILPTASIQDIGNTYRYEYRMMNDESGVLDVYDSTGKVKFNKTLGGVAMSQNKDASMAFRINTIYPIVSMRVSAEGIDTKAGQFVMEYSLDEAQWTDLPYAQQDGGPQIFDAAIDAAGKSIVYVRARSVKDGSKFNDWGIKNLRITAEMRK
ncbi:MAG: hypothetical protein HGA31_03020 [Candidatus Moranbacteria bacterium]|nr:hypothetical protein [Candidatus Moranbacteria bacterium]